MATACYIKLQLRKAGSYRIIKVQLRTVVKDEDGAANAVFIYRSTESTRSESNGTTRGIGPAWHGESTQTTRKALFQQSSQMAKNLFDKTRKLAEYAVKKMTEHKGDGRIWRFIVR